MEGRGDHREEAARRGADGFVRGRNLDKIGMKAQDTAELFFEDVFVPATNVVGEPGRGFYHLMKGLAQERLACAVTSTAVMERALELTAEFVRTRQVFGQSLGAFQNTQFALADVKAATEVCRTFTDEAISELVDDDLSPERAAVAKMFITERQWEVVDSCLQLFGGAGYMNEYEIARLVSSGARIDGFGVGSAPVIIRTASIDSATPDE